MRNGKHAHDNPRIRCAEVKRLRRTEIKVQVALKEVAEVLPPDFLQGVMLISG